MEKNWLSTEHLVKMIENSITPDAIVQHNVFLPDLSSSAGTTRQCDVIIRTGKPPRETLTIVEVQNRERKVDINDFQGWVGKMKDVGAQHLICVSTTGFPESIKEKAKMSGNTVRLITIRKHDTEKLPLKVFRFTLATTKTVFDIKALKLKTLIKVTALNKVKKISNSDKVFSVDNDLMCVSANELIQYALRINNQKNDGEKNIILPFAGQRLFYNYYKRKIPIEFDCRIRLRTIVDNESEAEIYSYDQDEIGPLAWIFEASVMQDDKKITVKIPAVQVEDGSFNIRTASMEFEKI